MLRWAVLMLNEKHDPASTEEVSLFILKYVMRTE